MLEYVFSAVEYIHTHFVKLYMVTNYRGEYGGAMQIVLYSIVFFHILETLWSIYVSKRQESVVFNCNVVPKVLSKVMLPETFDAARAYTYNRLNFIIIRTFVMSLGVATQELIFCLLPIMWETARYLNAALGLPTDSEMSHSCVFVVLLTIYSTCKNLPWTFYHTFHIEERHGFNKQTIGFFVKDQLKAFFLGLVMALPLVCAVIYIVHIGGTQFYLWLWLFAVVVSLTMMTIYPIFIAPLFDKYTELPAGELRTQIEALASRLEFPLTKLFVVDGSTRSAHSNAYFYGLWNSKRIVLFDTLLADHGKKAEAATETSDKTSDKPDESTKDKSTKAPPAPTKKPKKQTGCRNDEVVAVLAHELGHWKLNHVTKNILIGQANLFLLFVLFGYMFDNKFMFMAFGFDGEKERPVIVGLILLGNHILTLYNFAIDFATTVLSRRFEYQADEFAVKLGYAEPLSRALVKLNADNLGFPVYDWLYSAFNHSHPPLLHRLARMQRVTETEAKKTK